MGYDTEVEMIQGASEQETLTCPYASRPQALVPTSEDCLVASLHTESSGRCYRLRAGFKYWQTRYSHYKNENGN